jgi:hypothetical protein
VEDNPLAAVSANREASDFYLAACGHSDRFEHGSPQLCKAFA